MKVWIDQDLCTGDGLCEEIAPDVFFGMDDGLFYVKESEGNFGAEKLFDGAATRRAPTVRLGYLTAVWRGSSRRQVSAQVTVSTSKSTGSHERRPRSGGPVATNQTEPYRSQRRRQER